MVNLLDKRYLIPLCYNFCKNGAVCKKSQEIRGIVQLSSNWLHAYHAGIMNGVKCYICYILLLEVTHTIVE